MLLPTWIQHSGWKPRALAHRKIPNITGCLAEPRISEEQKRALLRYGPLSSSIRDALSLNLDTKKSEQPLSKLQALAACRRLTDQNWKVFWR
jgi:hypothetical protein